MSEREEILKGLEPLFKEAEEKGLWFYGNYHGIWFSPENLKREHKEGRFIWGAVNWQLRDRKEYLKQEIIANLNRTKELSEDLKRLEDV